MASGRGYRMMKAGKCHRITEVGRSEIFYDRQVGKWKKVVGQRRGDRKGRRKCQP